MAWLTAGRTLRFKGVQDEVNPRLDDNKTFYAGGILTFSGGYATHAGNAADQEVAGVATGVYEDGDRVDEKIVGQNQHPRAQLKKGKVWIPVSGSSQADVGVIHFVIDDSTLSKAAGNRTVGYRALDFEAGSLLFDFRVPDRIK